MIFFSKLDFPPTYYLPKMLLPEAESLPNHICYLGPNHVQDN